MSQAQREKVIAEAMTWLGTPYHHAAAIKGAGVDCAMILLEVYAAAGVIDRFAMDNYPPDWMLHRSEERYLAGVQQHAHEVEQPQPGDMALFKFGRCFSHSGIIVDYPRIIHAYRPVRRVVLDDLRLNSDLAAREVKFFSLWSD